MEGTNSLLTRDFLRPMMPFTHTNCTRRQHTTEGKGDYDEAHAHTIRDHRRVDADRSEPIPGGAVQHGYGVLPGPTGPGLSELCAGGSASRTVSASLCQ